MAAPDMEVIKDIPGYKVILKAVLKSQIQTLVEQLASTTDEESVILTASVVDGTLSHLGSSSGKVFLEDHEDIKSQFLGFCLKHHHKQKQEKERREAQEREEAMQRSMQAMRQQQQARFSSPGRQGYPHPMGMVRAAGPARMRTPPLRHQPYPMSRPQRPARSPGHAQPSTPSKIDGQIIKIEPEDNSNQSESDNVQTQDPSGTGSGSTETSQPSSPLVKPATPSHGPGASDNDDGESSNSTIPLNDGSDLKLSDTNPPGGLSLDSDLSNIIAASTSGDTNNEQQQQQGVNYDPNISVKLENVSGDPEMDLEITGVELGQRPVPEPSGSQEWMANVQDYMQGATGSAADMSTNQQGYSPAAVIHPNKLSDKNQEEENEIVRKLRTRSLSTEGISLTIKKELCTLTEQREAATRLKAGSFAQMAFGHKIGTDGQMGGLFGNNSSASWQMGGATEKLAFEQTDHAFAQTYGTIGNKSSPSGQKDRISGQRGGANTNFITVKSEQIEECQSGVSKLKILPKIAGQVGGANEQKGGANEKQGGAYEQQGGAKQQQGGANQQHGGANEQQGGAKGQGIGIKTEHSFSVFSEAEGKDQDTKMANIHTVKFPCKVCNKVFRTNGKLIIHMRAHSGEKPFECIQCYKPFPSKAKLTKHVKLVHKTNMF